MSRGKKYDAEFKAKAIERFHAAKAAGTPSIASIAKELGIGDGQLHQWARNNKSKKKSKTDSRTQYPIALKQKAVAMLASGMNGTAVARELKVAKGVVSYWHKHPPKRGAKGEEGGVGVPVAKPSGELTDALIYLRHAEKEIMEMIRDGKISRPDPAHLLTLLALAALTRASKP